MIRSELQRDGQVLHLLLDDPPGNVIDSRMIDAIGDAVDAIGDAVDALKVVVFEGAGANFSYGASVEEHSAEHVAGMLERFHGLFGRLAELAVPTAALVRGQCLGGGLELASWCTWIAASPDARFGQPEIKLAVFPPMASVLLPWRCGGGHALDLCTSGRAIDAARAFEIGLITAVDEDPTEWFERFFDEHLQPLSASSVRIADRALRGDLVETMKTRLPALEELYLEELMSTHDANEGIAAFLERRTPRYEHR